MRLELGAPLLLRHRFTREVALVHRALVHTESLLPLRTLLLELLNELLLLFQSFTHAAGRLKHARLRDDLELLVRGRTFQKWLELLYEFE